MSRTHRCWRGDRDDRDVDAIKGGECRCLVASGVDDVVRAEVLGELELLVLVTLGVGTLALVRIWQVFPFDLGTAPLDWALVVRLALAVGILGSCLGMLVALATFVRRVLKA